MRAQHRMEPPPSRAARGRRRNLKRKRDEPEANGGSALRVYVGPDTSRGHPQIALNQDDWRSAYRIDSGAGGTRNGPVMLEFEGFEGEGEEDAEALDEEDEGELDGVPEHLAVLQDPATGLILGRTPALVKYVVMKAKHRCALAEHESLLEELKAARQEELMWRERKDLLLDEVLIATFGCVDAELLVDGC